MGRKGRKSKKYIWPSFCLGAAAAWCVSAAGGVFAGGAGVRANVGQEGTVREEGAKEAGGRVEGAVKGWGVSGAEEGKQEGQQEGQQREKTIALTFDDGPHEKWTPALLDGLKERGVKATFFLMGENIEGKEEIVKRMAAEGHLIGNHSYRHIQLTRAGTEDVCRAIEKTEEIIEDLTGVKPQYVRPPYGDWNEELECRTNLTTVLWDVDSLDWKTRDRRSVADKVCREVSDGDIILMHDIFQSSQEAALDIVDRLAGEGWRFVTVDELVID